MLLDQVQEWITDHCLKSVVLHRGTPLGTTVLNIHLNHVFQSDVVTVSEARPTMCHKLYLAVCLGSSLLHFV